MAFFYDYTIDRHTVDAVLLDGTGLLPILDRLGQQPLAPLITDPAPPEGIGHFNNLSLDIITASIQP